METPEIMFKEFVEDCFESADVTDSVIWLELQLCWRQWKRYNYNGRHIAFDDLCKLMKDYCGNGSTLDRYIGIRMSSIGLDAFERESKK